MPVAQHHRTPGCHADDPAARPATIWMMTPITGPSVRDESGAALTIIGLAPCPAPALARTRKLRSPGQLPYLGAAAAGVRSNAFSIRTTSPPGKTEPEVRPKEKSLSSPEISGRTSGPDAGGGVACLRGHEPAAGDDARPRRAIAIGLCETLVGLARLSTVTEFCPLAAMTNCRCGLIRGASRRLFTPIRAWAIRGRGLALTTGLRLRRQRRTSYLARCSRRSYLVSGEAV